MTLEPYDPERLDALALRVLDISVHLRSMARICREEQLPSLDLHDRKAQEWLNKLEDWALGAQSDLNVQVMKNRGARAARAKTVRSP